jgi:hypothetical protein
VEVVSTTENPETAAYAQDIFTVFARCGTNVVAGSAVPDRPDQTGVYIGTPKSGVPANYISAAEIAFSRANIRSKYMTILGDSDQSLYIYVAPLPL